VAQVDITIDFLTLMTPDGSTKEDIRLPEGELGTQIQSEFESGKELLVTCVSAVGQEQVSSHCLQLDRSPHRDLGYFFQRSPPGFLNLFHTLFGHISGAG